MKGVWILLGRNFKDLVGIMETLMSKDGCPWDKEQTHDSLKSCLIEEVYEIVDAVDSKDTEQLKEELADLFFLISFHWFNASLAFLADLSPKT